jgi:hypothetical protein
VGETCVMVLEIQHVGGRYRIEASPPHGPEGSTATVRTPTEVLEVVSWWGCHSTGITDALDTTGQNWRPEHNAEVIRRRNDH